MAKKSVALVSKGGTEYRRVTKSKHRRSGKGGISLAIIAGLAPTAVFALEGYSLPGNQGGIAEALHRLTMRLTGYEWKNNDFKFDQLVQGWGPIFAGAFAHKLANRYGINRMIRNAGIPFISI